MKATEAREKAVIQQNRNVELDNILYQINAYASNGKMSIKFYGISYNPKTIQALKDLGYSVSIDEYTDTVIKW
jgi:hypothetical protein